MVWWVVMLIALGFQIVSNLLAKQPNAKPEEEPKLPRNDGSASIPVVFGECLVTGAQILDYFDFKAVPIKRRNPGTLFLTSVTIGYRYYLGMVFGVCWGKNSRETGGAELMEILIDNRIAWRGTDGTNAEQAGGGYLGALTPLYVRRRSFFGSEQQQGGIEFKGVWYGGGDLTYLGFPPTVNAYWEAQRGLTMPIYTDLAYFVFYGPSDTQMPANYNGELSGYIGNTTNLWPIAFKVVRRPLLVSNGVVSACGDTPSGAGPHANPIECLVEVLTSTDYGAGIPIAQLRAEAGTIGGIGSFSAAAYQCWSEGLGFSYLWNSASPVEEMVAEILRYVNGVLWTDLQTGLINVLLIREEVTTPPIYTNDDFLEIESFTRGSWEDTKNDIRVTFPDHEKVDFEESTAYYQEFANRQIQGVADAVEIRFRGCPSMRLANRLAAREARPLATPLARLTARIDRKLWRTAPGGLFRFTWPEQSITNLTLRVANIKLGTILDGRITITAVQDVFAVGRETYGNPDSTVWTDPLAGAAVDALGAAGEIPYWLQRDDVPRAFGVAARPTASHIAYNGALDGDVDALDCDFAPTGTLQAAYPQLSVGDVDSSNSLVIENLVDKSAIVAASHLAIAAEGATLAILGDPSGNHEWIAFQSITTGSSTVTLNNVWRGLLDTPPRAHAAGTRIWFFSVGNALFTTPLNDGEVAVFEALTRTPRNQLDPSAATNRTVTIRRRAFRPLPPYYVLFGGSYTNEIYGGSGDLVFTWREHARASMLQVLKQSATTETAETGITYEVEVVGQDGTTIGRTVTGLTSPTYTYTSADLATDFAGALQTPLYFRFYSKRDGVRSLYPWERRVYDFGGSSSMAQDADTMFEGIETMVEI